MMDANAHRVIENFIKPLRDALGTPRIPGAVPQKIFEILAKELRRFDNDTLEHAVFEIVKKSDFFPNIRTAYQTCLEIENRIKPKMRKMTKDEEYILRDSISMECAEALLRENKEVVAISVQEGWVAELYMFLKENMRFPSEKEIENLKNKMKSTTEDLKEHPYAGSLISFRKAVEKRAIKDAGI